MSLDTMSCMPCTLTALFTRIREPCVWSWSGAPASRCISLQHPAHYLQDHTRRGFNSPGVFKVKHVSSRVQAGAVSLLQPIMHTLVLKCCSVTGGRRPAWTGMQLVRWAMSR